MNSSDPTRISNVLPGICARWVAKLCLVLFCLQAAAAPDARASGKDVRTVLYASGYGVLGGTALGLVSLPFHRSGKGIYLGSLLGLGLGLMVGVYHVTHRDDPGNPLRGYGGVPGSGERLTLADEGWRGEGRFAVPRPEIEWAAPVFRFD